MNLQLVYVRYACSLHSKFNKIVKEDLFVFGHLFLFLRNCSLFIDIGSTGHVPHLQTQTVQHTT